LLQTSLTGHIQHCLMRVPFGGLAIYTETVDGSLMISQVQYYSYLDQVIRPANQLAKIAKEQIEAYFDNPHFSFDLPIKNQGTPFQQRVWAKIGTISAGQTISYGDLATRLKTSPRAVGGACAANFYPLIIPCHRVLSKIGVGGFMGEASGPYLQIKHWLLSHEKAIKN